MSAQHWHKMNDVELEIDTLLNHIGDCVTDASHHITKTRQITMTESDLARFITLRNALKAAMAQFEGVTE